MDVSTRFTNFAPNIKKMKRYILLFLASVLFAIISIAQNKSNFHMELLAQTKYLWRGIEYGTSPVIFPTLSYSNNGIYIYGMGGYATDGSHQEVDLGISYNFKDILLPINDYYYPTPVGENDKYFNLKGKETGHWFESCIQYSPSKIPVWCLLSTYFAGADKKTESKSQAWSSYAEIGGHYDFDNNNVLSLGILNAGGNYYDAIISIINTLPFPYFAMILLVITMIMFYATSFDTLTLIAPNYSYKHIESNEEPHKIIRTLWALIFILLPIGLLFSNNSMYGLQSISIIAASPIGIII